MTKSRSPLMLASMSQSPSPDAQIDTLRIFLNEFDFSNDADRSVDGWRALFLYVDTRRGNEITFDWLLRNCLSEITRNFNRKEFVVIIHWINVYSRFLLTSLLLSLGSETIKRKFDGPIPSECPVIHKSIDFQRGTVALIRWGMNIHTPHDLKEPDMSFLGLISPTSYAMLSSRTFHYWRKSLQLAEVNIEDFVKRECEIGTIVDEGWEEDTLLKLFQSTLPPVQLAHSPCSKCNSGYMTYSLAVIIEVSWCLELEKIKTKGVDPVGNVQISQINTILGTEKQEGKGIHCPCVQKYDFVCWECWDELKDPDHQHESDNEED